MNRADSQFAHRASFAADTLLHGKWKVHILCAMRSGPIRLGQLARTIPRASKKVLTQNLRDLEAVGVIMRTDLSDTVLHIEYELKADVKNSVCVLLERLAEWGDAYLKMDTGASPQKKWGKAPEEELDSGRAAGERGAGV